MESEALSLDGFLGGNIYLYQPKNSYRSGIDAVLLAASCPAKNIDHVADFGSGIGTVGLCIKSRVQSVQVTLIERHSDIVDIAKKNISRNHFSFDETAIVQADLTHSILELKNAGLIPNQFHHIVMNPPFFEANKSQRPKDDYQAQAHMFEADELKKWLDNATWALKSRGSLSIIYPAQGILDILSHLNGRYGNIHILPIHSKANSPAKRVIIQAYRDKKSPLKLLPPLILHDQNGQYTPRVEAVLRESASLSLCFENC